MNPVAVGWLLWLAQVLFCITALVVFVQAALFVPRARYFGAAASFLVAAIASRYFNSWWPLLAALAVLEWLSPWIDLPDKMKRKPQADTHGRGWRGPDPIADHRRRGAPMRKARSRVLSSA
jgi:hypothetical protein